MKVYLKKKISNLFSIKRDFYFPQQNDTLSTEVQSQLQLIKKFIYVNQYTSNIWLI